MKRGIRNIPIISVRFMLGATPNESDFFSGQLGVPYRFPDEAVAGESSGEHLRATNAALQEKLVESEKLIVELERRLQEPRTLSAMAFNQQITGKLKLKPGTPIEVILDTIQLIQLHAERYREACTDGSINIPAQEWDRLLTIERGHQADKASARAAESALERAHNDLNAFAKEHDINLTSSADGSRRTLLNQVGAHILALESEAKSLREKDHAMQVVNVHRIFRPSTFHIEEINGKPLEHYLELERLAQTYGVEKIVDAHAERRGELLAVMAVLGRAGMSHDIKWMVQEIDRLKEREKVIAEVLGIIGSIQNSLGVCPNGVPTNRQLGELIQEEIKRLQSTRMEAEHGITYIAQRLNVYDPAHTITSLCGLIHEAIKSRAEGGGQVVQLNAKLEERLMQNEHDYAVLMADHQKACRKLATLRTIVLRKAPHTSDCQISKIGVAPCGCWKAEFMAEADNAS